MQAICAILFIGLPVLVCIVIPMCFLNAVDRDNPADPDMW